MARALNRDVEALIRQARLAGAQPLESLPHEETRRVYAASRREQQPPFDPLDDMRDVQIPVVDGSITLRIMRSGAAGEVLPCLLFMHGGGWVLGDLDSHEGMCRKLAVRAHCCVISVDYRLAPEHPFPTAVEDSVAALLWVTKHAEALSIDPARIAVGGDSAGGNLAAVLSLMGRNCCVPKPVFQLLLYPAVDLRMASTSFDHAAQGMLVDSKTIRWFVDQYAPREADRDDWRASPARASSLAGTPPAFVLTCGHDPLCEEGRAYAERLERDGVAVTALHLSDQAHGVLNTGKDIAAVASALNMAAATLVQYWRD
ncbi:alpha/beta hydrolase [Paraburkholderia caribensis]|uniref:alpha/beta hydrolase n=1 Tax=Paraburkholderia caribensis TaxID=75105 RepID=UPI00078DE56B|nr:alpha/beta hydrolase [Paraburkholderia caribensis]AMV48329.1 alpha/beta hydrolase [Paraburkholderia caribensis]